MTCEVMDGMRGGRHAEPLGAWTGLPVAALQAIGVVLVPWGGLLAWLASRPGVPGVAVGTVIALNFVWALDCALAAFGVVGSPSGVGVAVLAVQAVGTVVLAELGWVGIRRAPVLPSGSPGALAR